MNNNTVTEADVEAYINQLKPEEERRKLEAALERERQRAEQERVQRVKELQAIAADNPHLWLDDEGYLQVFPSSKPTTTTTPKQKRLRQPLLPTVYEFELPPFSTMKPYRTGSMTELSSYWKHGGRNNEQNFSKRFEQARPYEVYVAQLLWNDGLTPFLDSAEDVSQHPKRKELLKSDQADICVMGKLVEVKSLSNFYSRTMKIDGEEYVFMCSTSSYAKQLTPRDYYVLVCRSELKEDIENWSALRQLKAEEYKPLVVPVDRAKFVEYEWKDSERDAEMGIFVRKADLIPFKSFVWELKRHYNKLQKQSNKLNTVEVVRLFYPHLKSLDELMALHPTLTQEQVKQLYAGQDDGSELEWRVAREQEMLDLYIQTLFDF